MSSSRIGDVFAYGEKGEVIGLSPETNPIPKSRKSKRRKAGRREEEEEVVRKDVGGSRRGKKSFLFLLC